MAIEGITSKQGVEALKFEIQKGIQQVRSQNVEKLDLKGIAPDMKVGKANSATAPTFSDVLKAGLQEVDRTQKVYEHTALQALRGEKGVHEVMLSQQEAKKVFTFCVECKNELTKAYNELMRMAV